MAKILLIEDDPLVIRMYQKILVFEGFEVEGAMDGREGVEKALQFQPDLIFCDVMMPKVNGIQVLERLKSNPATASIPVIMLTNLSGTQDAEMAIEKGAVAYFVKSEFKPKEVADKAKELIESRSVGSAAPEPEAAQTQNQEIATQQANTVNQQNPAQDQPQDAPVSGNSSDPGLVGSTANLPANQTPVDTDDQGFGN